MTKKYDDQGLLHSDDSPAVTHDDGSWVFYRHGLIHRAEGAAVHLVFPDGSTEDQFWFAGREIK